MYCLFVYVDCWLHVAHDYLPGSTIGSEGKWRMVGVVSRGHLAEWHTFYVYIAEKIDVGKRRCLSMLANMRGQAAGQCQI
jgi:hypothetical protein